jgi:thiamine-monophosphate kinase
LACSEGALALSDDAALIAPKAGEDLVVTCDAVAEGVHFFADDPPEAIAQKALRVNLSDLAAKGATPLGYLMALALPSDWTESWVERFAAGLADDDDRYGVTLLGGDTIRAAGGVTIAITAIGSVPKGKMVRRSGARPGDAIMVSGTIGDAALGLRLRTKATAAGVDDRLLLDRYLLPQPRTALAPLLRRYATSAIDVSDGLIGDLAHICDVSGVGAEVRANAVPLSAPAADLVRLDADAWMHILNGGDDYEILATVAEHEVAAFADEARATGVAVANIGRITGGEGPPVVKDREGRIITVTSASHVHF